MLQNINSFIVDHNLYFIDFVNLSLDDDILDILNIFDRFQGSLAIIDRILLWN